MRRLGGFLLVAVGVALLVVTNVEASGGGSERFDSMVRALSARYAVQPTKIPMMWMVSLCARGATHGGVRGMKVVQFEHFADVADHDEFDAIVQSKLGDGWPPTVRERDSDGKESLVYTREDGRLMEFVVVDLDHGELNAVRMEMNPEQLAKWVDQHGRASVHDASAQ